MGSQIFGDMLLPTKDNQWRLQYHIAWWISYWSSEFTIHFYSMNYIDFSLFFFTFGIDEVAIVNAFSCPTYFHEICGVDAPVKVNPAVGGGGIWQGAVWPYMALWHQQYFPAPFWHHKWYKYKTFPRGFCKWNIRAGWGFWTDKQFLHHNFLGQPQGAVFILTCAFHIVNCR